MTKYRCDYGTHHEACECREARFAQIESERDLLWHALHGQDKATDAALGEGGKIVDLLHATQRERDLALAALRGVKGEWGVARELAIMAACRGLAPETTDNACVYRIDRALATVEHLMREKEDGSDG